MLLYYKQQFTRNNFHKQHLTLLNLFLSYIKNFISNNFQQPTLTDTVPVLHTAQYKSWHPQQIYNVTVPDFSYKQHITNHNIQNNT